MTRLRPRRLSAAGVVGLCVLLVPGVAGAELAPPPPPLVDELPPGWPSTDDIDGLEELAAYLLLDASDGQVLAASNAQTRRPVASTIKVLTALTAVERTTLEEQVTAGEEVAGIPGSGVGLQPGETWSVEDLVEALIARSGNEAAEALAVHVAGDTDGYLELMEGDAAAIGVTGLDLVSVSGLDDANLLSAADLATISRVALEHPELRDILGAAEVTLPSVGTVPTRNLLLLDYPDATGVKTGFTQAAGNSLVGSAARDGRELVVVVLGAGDDPARFTLAGALLDHGFEAFRPAEVAAQLTVTVAGGEVAIEVPATELTVPADASVDLDVPVPVWAPDVAPTVPVLVDGQAVAELAAEQDTSAVPATVEGGAAVGRAAADGVYAALRAATAAGALR